MHPVYLHTDILPDGRPVMFQGVDLDNPDVIAALTALASGAVDKKAAGWLDLTNLPGQPDGATKWDVLMTHAQNAAHKDKLAPVVAAIPAKSPDGQP